MFFWCTSADVENKRGLIQPSVNAAACFNTRGQPDTDTEYYAVNRVINT